MNILTLILIIMKTKEELLAVLQNLGLSFCISNPIQEGTWVFKFDKALSFMQKDSINTEIDYHFGYMVSWHKNWLTVYPEIQSQVLRNFRDTVDNVGEAHQAYFKTFTFREQKNLSPKQFIIRINFDAPATKKILKEICWKFQERNNTFCKVLTNNEFLIDCAAQVDIEALKKEHPELIILDIMLPKIDGFELAKRIRSNSNVPIIIMTALGDEANMLKGYQLNCDDYIVKPFSPKVLVSKANVLLKRINNASNLTNIYKVGPLELNFLTNELKIDGITKEISKTEFELLAFLIKNKNKACSRTLLLDEIWGLDVYVDGRIVDTYIKNLRKILKPYTYIKTIFGIGYQFEDNYEKN